MKNTWCCSRCPRHPDGAAGDEFGRTQGGNNNAYNQDNETSGSTGTARRFADLERFCGELLALRHRHAAMLHPDWWADDVAFFGARGPTTPLGSRSLAWMRRRPVRDPNTWWEPLLCWAHRPGRSVAPRRRHRRAAAAGHPGIAWLGRGPGRPRWPGERRAPLGGDPRAVGGSLGLADRIEQLQGDHRRRALVPNRCTASHVVDRRPICCGGIMAHQFDIQQPAPRARRNHRKVMQGVAVFTIMTGCSGAQSSPTRGRRRRRPTPAPSACSKTAVPVAVVGTTMAVTMTTPHRRAPHRRRPAPRRRRRARPTAGRDRRRARPAPGPVPPGVWPRVRSTNDLPHSAPTRRVSHCSPHA